VVAAATMFVTPAGAERADGGVAQGGHDLGSGGVRIWERSSS
jgi:hypothetical protein